MCSVLKAKNTFTVRTQQRAEHCKFPDFDNNMEVAAKISNRKKVIRFKDLALAFGSERPAMQGCYVVCKLNLHLSRQLSWRIAI